MTGISQVMARFDKAGGPAPVVEAELCHGALAHLPLDLVRTDGALRSAALLEYDGGDEHSGTASGDAEPQILVLGDLQVFVPAARGPHGLRP